MDNLYLISRRHYCCLSDMKAAIDLLREIYGGQYRGPGFDPLAHMVYATNRPVPVEEREVLGIIIWE